MENISAEQSMPDLPAPSPIHNRYVRWILYFLVYGTVIVVFGYHLILHAINTTKVAAIPCPSLRETVSWKIHDGRFEPPTLTVSRCQTVKILNQDSVSRDPAFGPHPKHIVYGDFHERLLRPGQANSFTASITGTYPAHDHLEETVAGTMVVR
ncbi:MAG: hypothetical protein HY092_01405 [Candidatus Kerfeldbacteria bacterium]|nr:hypothetical protein [Candidatus Kerfeldbacteria bacterium]